MDSKIYMAGVFDRAAATYERTGVSFFAPVGEELVRQADLKPGENVLDVGCGTGASLFPAARAVGTTGDVIGMDLSPGMLSIAKEEIARRGLKHASVVEGDAEHAHELLPGWRFDAATAGMVLYFLPDPLAAVRSLSRLVRPGGRIAVSLLAEPSTEERDLLAVVARTLAPYSVGGTPGEAPLSRQDLQTGEGLSELLVDGGFSRVRCVERTFDVQLDRFRVWDWLWSAARRASLEHIPALVHPPARAALVAALPYESFVLPRRVRFAVGVR